MSQFIRFLLVIISLASFLTVSFAKSDFEIRNDIEDDIIHGSQKLERFVSGKNVEADIAQAELAYIKALMKQYEEMGGLSFKKKTTPTRLRLGRIEKKLKDFAYNEGRNETMSRRTTFRQRCKDKIKKRYLEESKDYVSFYPDAEKDHKSEKYWPLVYPRTVYMPKFVNNSEVFSERQGDTTNGEPRLAFHVGDRGEAQGFTVKLSDQYETQFVNSKCRVERLIAHGIYGKDALYLNRNLCAELPQIMNLVEAVDAEVNSGRHIMCVMQKGFTDKDEECYCKPGRDPIDPYSETCSKTGRIVEGPPSQRDRVAKFFTERKGYLPNITKANMLTASRICNERFQRPAISDQGSKPAGDSSTTR